MPIFDFHCSQCDQDFELLLLSRSEVAECPRCSSRDLQKLASITAAQPKTPGLLTSARKRAAREGHFSHYAASEKPKL